MARILIARGHNATPWELRPWAELPERFEVEFLETESNGYDTASLDVKSVPVRALRDRLPRNLAGEVVTGLLKDRYTQSADAAFAAADIVHAAELAFWFAADAARRKPQGHYRLVQTVWETLPFLEAYRTGKARAFRRQVLEGTDLFIAMTERARSALLLEGVPDERIVVSYPGIDVERFRSAGATPRTDRHVILSPGRLVWEKGHQDAIRALALLHRGIVRDADGGVHRPYLRIVGNGPERERLAAHAAELGVGGFVTFESLPYDAMPGAFHEASCLLLGSMSSATAGFHPFDIPRIFWEEQFGMVFAEAMAAGLDIITTTSGAIPEVMGGAGTLVAPGDYVGMAHALANGPLRRPPGARVEYPAALVERYSTTAAANRLAVIYDRLLAP